VTLHGAHAVLPLHDEAALHLRERPAVATRDTAQRGHVFGHEIDLCAARLARKRVERDQVDARFAKRLKHTCAVSGAVRDRDVDVADFADPVGHGSLRLRGWTGPALGWP